MGLIRKITSASTLGAVDYRSDKERTAKYARQTRNAVRQGNNYQRGVDGQANWNAQLAEWNTARQPPPGGFAPGWYIDEHDPRFVRWWDPTGPTQHVQPMPPPEAPPLPPPGMPGAPPPAAGLGEELARLADLHRQGALSDDEFAAAKARLLG